MPNPETFLTYGAYRRLDALRADEALRGGVAELDEVLVGEVTHVLLRLAEAPQHRERPDEGRRREHERAILNHSMTYTMTIALEYVKIDNV